MADHYVGEIWEAIEATHVGLGRLGAMCMVAAKARQCLIIVAPPGCGKSRIGTWIVAKHWDGYLKHSVTRSSLKIYEEQFNDFTGCVVFDDVGAIDTEWSRVQTLVTMAEIVYGHFISKDSHQLHIEIDNFNGSAILNIQPNVLGEIVKDASWHANLADKSLRYYHLQRATKPNPDEIDVDIDWGLDLDEVDDYDGDSPIWQAVLNIGMEQWTRPRALEHCNHLLRAVSGLGGNPTPGDLELTTLLELMRPMTVEMEMIEKDGFGSKARVNDNLLYMLVEFATYNEVTYEIIAQDYHMKPSQAQRILSNMIDWFVKISNNPVKLRPSPRLEELFIKAGIR